MAGQVEKTGGINSNDRYMNTPEYREIKEQHPNSVINYDEESKTLTWVESGGIFNSKATAGTVRLGNDFDKPTGREIITGIMDQMDQYSLDKYKEEGFLIPKKDFINGEYYIFDAKKYKEVTGQDITLGEVKRMLGLENGVLRASNSIGFKDRGEGRDYDTAKIEDVLPSQKIKIPAKTLFQDNSERNFGMY